MEISREQKPDLTTDKHGLTQRAKPEACPERSEGTQ